MPATTPNRGYPYPINTDPIQTAVDMQALASAVDADTAAQITAAGAANAAQDARMAAIEGVNATQDNRLGSVESHNNNQQIQIDTNYLNRPDIFINNIPFGDKVHIVAQTWGGATDINGVGYVYFNPSWSNEFVNGPYCVCVNGDSNLQVVIQMLAALTTPSYFQYQARWFDGNPAGNAGVTVSFIAVGTRA